MSDPALARCLEDGDVVLPIRDPLRWLQQRHDATEAGRPFLFRRIGQKLEDPLHLLREWRLLAGKALAVESWLATQRIDLEPRIVGYGPFTGRLSGGVCLDRRVL